MPQTKKRPWELKVLTALRILLLIGFCSFGLVASLRLYRTWTTNKTNAELRDLKAFFVDSGEQVDWSDGMLDINEDYVGWLTVPGTNIDGPVVQGEDNDEYLRTDFYGEHSIAGTLFMDEMVDVSDSKANRIIYGHMMYDSTMFGDLKHFKTRSFFEKHEFVVWEDRFGLSCYRLFAAVIVSGSATNTEYLNIQQWAGALDKEQTSEMLTILSERAFLYRDDMFRGENQYIFLVTCDGQQNAWRDNKLILVGERISADEDEIQEWVEQNDSSEEQVS